MDESRAHKLQILPCRSNVERVVAINAALLATLRETDRRIFAANERLRHWPRHVLAPLRPAPRSPSRARSFAGWWMSVRRHSKILRRRNTRPMRGSRWRHSELRFNRHRHRPVGGVNVGQPAGPNQFLLLAKIVGEKSLISPTTTAAHRVNFAAVSSWSRPRRP